MLIPKVIDKKYTEWIKTRPCAFCNTPPPSEPHHVRGIDGMPGTSRKPSDHLVLPACHDCHEGEQQYKSRPIKGHDYASGVMRKIIFHLSEYIEETKSGQRTIK